MRNIHNRTAQLISTAAVCMIMLTGLTLPRASAQESLPTAGSRVDTSQVTAPVNDLFANATFIGISTGIAGTNVGATLEQFEPASGPNDKSVWYKFTTNVSYSETFQTGANTLSDTVLTAFTGTAIANLTQVAFNDDISAQNHSSRVTMIVNPGITYYLQVRGYSGLSGTFSLSSFTNLAEAQRQFNFDNNTGNDNRIYSDYAVFRPSEGNWYISLGGSNGALRSQQWGTNTDIIYPGDFDGDGVTDVGVWRPSNGTVYVTRSTDQTLMQVQWGQAGDVPVQGDFDGDDVADLAVWRPSVGTFYILQSTNGQLMSTQFGQAGDRIACGDFDGDGKTDLGVVRDAGGQAFFYLLRSSDAVVTGRQFGLAGDLYMPGDYDNDGKNDIAVYRPSTNAFYAVRSSNGSLLSVAWGSPGDIPVPGNYIGTGASDITVFRPSTGTFYSYDSQGNQFLATIFGTNGDIPIARSNVH